VVESEVVRRPAADAGVPVAGVDALPLGARGSEPRLLGRAVVPHVVAAPSTVGAP
jgi:hypothetical protein